MDGGGGDGGGVSHLPSLSCVSASSPSSTIIRYYFSSAFISFHFLALALSCSSDERSERYGDDDDDVMMSE